MDHLEYIGSEAAAEVAIVMPCGYDAQRSAEEADEFGDRLAGIGAKRIVAVDASAYFSRPGPRLVTGIELLGHLLHPDRVPHAVADYVVVAGAPSRR